MKLSLIKLSNILISIRKEFLTKYLQHTLFVKSSLDKFQVKRSLPIDLYILSVKSKSKSLNFPIFIEIANSLLVSIRIYVHPFRSFKCQLKCLLVLNPQYFGMNPFVKNILVVLPVQMKNLIQQNSLLVNQSINPMIEVIYKYARSIGLQSSIIKRNHNDVIPLLISYLELRVTDVHY